MLARIYQPAKTAMSSGTARSRKWVLEFVSDTPIRKDRLTGWNGSDDTQSQSRLRFDTLEEAKAYAAKAGIAARIIAPHKRQVAPKAYADNFKHDRIDMWSH